MTTEPTIQSLISDFTAACCAAAGGPLFIAPVAVGDEVRWDRVPSGAMVLSDAAEGVYTMRQGSQAVHVGGPASWAGFKSEAAKFGTWTWQGIGTVKVVALGLTGDETGDELHAIALLEQVISDADAREMAGVELLARLKWAFPAPPVTEAAAASLRTLADDLASSGQRSLVRELMRHLRVTFDDPIARCRQ